MPAERRRLPSDGDPPEPSSPWPARRRRPGRGPAPGPRAAALVRGGQGRPRALHRRRSRRHRGARRRTATTCSSTSSCSTSRPPSARRPGCSARSGARYLTMHARGDVDMLRAGVDGFREGAAAAGLPDAVPAGGHRAHQRRRRPAAHPAEPRRAGRRGSRLRRASCARPPTWPRPARSRPGSSRVVPGIRPAGVDVHDQARAATPREAIDRRGRPARHRPGRHRGRRSGCGRRRHRRRGGRRSLTPGSQTPWAPSVSPVEVKASRRRISLSGAGSEGGTPSTRTVVLASSADPPDPSGVLGQDRPGAGPDDDADRRPREPRDQGQGDAEEAELVLVLLRPRSGIQTLADTA